MRQAGKVLRFWISVLGLVIGLQSAGIAAGSDSSGSSDQAVKEESSGSALPTQDAAPAPESGDGPSVQAGEVATKSEEVATKSERDRDHSARSLQEMLLLFLKGAGALTVLVLFYKGLKRCFGPKPQSE